jgi:hypothetical protein
VTHRRAQATATGALEVYDDGSNPIDTIDVECPRFGGQLSAGLSGPAERLSGHAKEAEVSEAVSAGVSA